MRNAGEEATRRIHLLSQVEHVGDTVAGSGRKQWDVKVERVAGEHLRISGRGSSMTVFLKQTLGGLMVSIPSHGRCGQVPTPCTASDIRQYCDLDNDVDAETLAAAIRYLSNPVWPLTTEGIIE